MAYLKGQNVNIYRAVTSGSSTSYVALATASTSCDFNLSPNTVDGSSKSDAEPMWDNPIFTYCDWSMSNESFIADAASLKTLINLAVAGEAITVVWDTNGTQKQGKAIITSLEVDAPSDDFAKLTISLDGSGALETSSESLVHPAVTTAKLRGKTLMLAYNDGDGYKTFCAATGHKLTLSVQTADTKTKDDNDLAISKEVTGYSMTVSTENLVGLTTYGESATDLLDKSIAGTTLPLEFGYYEGSSGKDVTEYNTSSAADTGYGAPTTLMVTANCICTSYSLSASNKENVTMSAEFTAQGKPTFAS